MSLARRSVNRDITVPAVRPRHAQFDAATARLKGGKIACHAAVLVSLPRRRLLLGTAGAAVLGVIGPPGPDAKAATDLVVGFIYIGSEDDDGCNQAHAEAAANSLSTSW